MIDGTIPTSKVVMATLWGTVAVLITAAWGLEVAGEVGWANLVGLTACVASAGATVAHIRCYALRLCAIIKATQAHSIDEMRRTY